MRRASFGQRLRYAFDNTMAKGPVALIAWLAVLSLGVIALATVVVMLLRISPAGADEAPGPHEVAWMSLMRTLDPGTMGGDQGWEFRVVMLLVTLGGIFIVSTLIGVVITGMDAKIRRRGEVAIGYRIASLARDVSRAYGVKVNRMKGETVTFADEDRIIVIAEVRRRTIGTFQFIFFLTFINHRVSCTDAFPRLGHAMGAFYCDRSFSNRAGRGGACFLSEPTAEAAGRRPRRSQVIEIQSFRRNLFRGWRVRQKTRFEKTNPRRVRGVARELSAPHTDAPLTAARPWARRRTVRPHPPSAGRPRCRRHSGRGPCRTGRTARRRRSRRGR
jgi:hypothetical protein